MREETYILPEEENIQWDFLLLGLRKHFNLSQKELSEKIDVSRRQIGKYERRYRTPNKKAQEEILSYVDSLGITLGELAQEGKEYIHPKNLRTIKEKKDITIDGNLGELMISSILEKYGYRPPVEKCEVGKRNIRRWKNGKRVPSPENAFKIKKIAESKGLL